MILEESVTKNKIPKKGPGKLNDQKTKPSLGNSITSHGRMNTDMPGLSEPSRNRPVVTKKRGKR